MPFPLLTTKLYVPAPPPKLVQRPRLIEQLNAGLDGRLTLVSAPAGYGKTTLVTEWLSSAARPFTWLSLDSSDTDPPQFLLYLVAALQGIDPAIGHAVKAMLQAPQPPPQAALLTGLINDIAATPQPFVLVLDDYHLVHTTPIHQQLAFLLEHQPPHMHLVIVTREDPLLPLSRWRARGQMTEIRQADLRFAEGEAADFLRRVMRLELSSAEVAALHQRTEGWIAGLQLAALSIRGRKDTRQLVQSFAGSHHYILDYLIDEVFQRQPVEVQDFLLQTSVLDHFTAPLCNAVTGREDSADLLLALEQGNLFTVALDQSRQWYRYHHLFGDLLRQRLQRIATPELVAQLHAEASRWYEAWATWVTQCILEWNDLEAAADHLQRGVQLGQRGGNVEIQIGGYRALARLKQAQGDASAALDALQQAHQLARGRGVPPLMRARNAACHVQLALAQDDLATATRWAEEATDGADASPFYPLLGLTQARLLLAHNQETAAAEQLAARHETAVDCGWRFGALEVRVLQALAAPTPAAALTFLADALTLGQPAGYVRTFVDKGEPMTALLRKAAAQGIAPDYVAKLLAAQRAAGP